MTNEPRYRRCAALDVEDFGDGVLLVDAAGQRIMELNASGAALWRALSAPADVGALAAALRARYPAVDPARAVADVDAFLRRAVAAGAIEETA